MNSFGRKIALEIGVVLFSFVLYVDLSWAAKFAIVSDVGKVENFMSRKRAGSISATGAELSRPWIAANFVPTCSSEWIRSALFLYPEAIVAMSVFPVMLSSLMMSSWLDSAGDRIMIMLNSGVRFFLECSEESDSSHEEGGKGEGSRSSSRLFQISVKSSLKRFSRLSLSSFFSFGRGR